MGLSGVEPEHDQGNNTLGASLKSQTSLLVCDTFLPHFTSFCLITTRARALSVAEGGYPPWTQLVEIVARKHFGVSGRPDSADEPPTAHWVNPPGMKCGNASAGPSGRRKNIAFKTWAGAPPLEPGW